MIQTSPERRLQSITNPNSWIFLSKLSVRELLAASEAHGNFIQRNRQGGLFRPYKQARAVPSHRLQTGKESGSRQIKCRIWGVTSSRAVAGKLTSLDNRLTIVGETSRPHYYDENTGRIGSIGCLNRSRLLRARLRRIEAKMARTKICNRSLMRVES
jgi:hypothetical protein